MRRALPLLLACVLLTACGTAAPAAPVATPSGPAALAFLAFSTDGGTQLVVQPSGAGSEARDLDLPAGCFPWSLSASPDHTRLALELVCPTGGRVLALDPRDGTLTELIDDPLTDQRLLAWAPDGSALYLRVDSLGDARVLLTGTEGGGSRRLSLPATLYDLAAAPAGRLAYSLTRGLGYGSQTYVADLDGRRPQLIWSEPRHLVTFLRWSPDGTQLAFIRMPDSTTPFPGGELWVMNADGTGARMLAPADAGHGYPPAWSPDGTQIAFVTRLNPDDPLGDQDPYGLVSAVSVIDLAGGAALTLSTPHNALCEAPAWAPDGSGLAFAAMIDGTIKIWGWNGPAGTPAPLTDLPSCCPAWIHH